LDAELNALKAMVNNVIAFFYPGESSFEARPPDARQPADKVSGDYSHQYEVVGESNSKYFEVPIPPG
jgi:hypothetical protein